MTSQPTQLRVAIAGVSGYTGQELLRLCARHPGLEITGVHATAKTAAAGRTAADVAPSARGLIDLPVLGSSAEEILSTKPDAALLAVPHDAAAVLAGELADAGVTVFDLSGAHRLAASDYPRHYDFEHPRNDLLDEAVYGLVELPGARERIADARLVAVPGCYTTASILALSPLHRAGLTRPRSPIIIDAMSGVSGAGRAANTDNLFCDVGLRPYKVLRHRHQPEIERYAGPAGAATAAADKPRVRFVPHVGPWARGIIATCHVPLAEGMTDADVRAAYADAYGAERFVRLLGDGDWPTTLAVERTNFVDLGVMSDDVGHDDPAAGGHAVVCAAIDNLTKGAAGQAVQCLNVRFGFDESEGLL